MHFLLLLLCCCCCCRTERVRGREFTFIHSHLCDDDSVNLCRVKNHERPYSKCSKCPRVKKPDVCSQKKPAPGSWTRAQRTATARRRRERNARADRFGDDAKAIAKQQRKSTPSLGKGRPKKGEGDGAGEGGGGLARKRSMTMAPARMARMAAIAKEVAPSGNGQLKRADSFSVRKDSMPGRRAVS